MGAKYEDKNKRKNAGDYWKQVKASRPLVDGPRRTSDGRADRCAVLGEHMQRLLKESSAFAFLCKQRIYPLLRHILLCVRFVVDS